MFIFLLSTINIYPVIVDHYCLSFYCWPLLFIFLLLAIIVYPFIVDHYCLSFYCRPLLFILFIVDHHCLSFYCRPLLFILLFRSLMFILLFRTLLFICLVSTIIIYPFIVDHYYTPAPLRGRGYTVLPLSVLPSVLPSFRQSKIFFVTLFSVTVDGRNLIFGHTRHIGIPYCG